MRKTLRHVAGDIVSITARAVLAGVLATLAACAGPSPVPSAGAPVAAPDTPAAKHLLVVTHTAGFRHSSIPVAESTLRAMGTSSGLYQTTFCRTEADVRAMLTADALRSVDAVFFANTTGDLGIPDLQAFLTWIAAGHAFLGAHSATDTYHDAPEYLAMIGGEFLTHGAIAEGDILVDDPADPAVAHLAPRLRMIDELYRFTRNNRGEVHVLLSLDRNPDDGVGQPGAPADLPLAWRKAFGGGRVFYTALGHREDVWQDARYQQHLLGAIRWAVGR